MLLYIQHLYCLGKCQPKTIPFNYMLNKDIRQIGSFP